jgi:hypothetical protein
MKPSLKLFVNAALSFAIIGFVTYLFILIAGFFGCCVGISNSLYDQIIIAIIAAAAISFGVCMYNNCYLSSKK